MKIKNAMSLLALSACAALSTSAMAQSSASVTIKGEVSADICNININGRNTSVLTLPRVTVSQLPNVGSTAGDSNITINLTDCDPTQTASGVQVNFSSPSTNTSTGRINTGVNNVSLQVLHSGRAINATLTPENRLQNTHTPTAVNSAGAASLTYAIRYYREGVGAITGSVDATANLSVAYL